MELMSFREFIDESKVFYRLPRKIIGNEVYVLKNKTKDMFSSLDAGNDFDIQQLNDIEKIIKSIRKAIVKNPSEEEMKDLDG